MSELAGSTHRNRRDVNPQEPLCNSPDGQTTYDGGDYWHLFRM